MKKILVTGANGQLGNEMRLLADEHKNFEYFFTDVAELDICDEQAVMDFVSTHQIDVIVNCAAYTAVDKAEDNVELCDKLNHVAPGYLAKAAQSRNGWLVQVSTDYVFDGTAHIPYKEEDTPCPNSVYGSTKLAGEQEALKQCPNTMVIRTAWLYSEFGKNFVKTMLNLTATKPQLKVVFDQTGTPTYAYDLAKAIQTVLKDYAAEQPAFTYSKTGIYHYSNEGVCSWYDFTKSIATMSGHTECDIQPCHSNEFPSPVKRPAYSVLDKTKIKETFSLRIPYWTDSLKVCIEHLTKKN